jgi:hypothetical protein
VRWFLIMSLVAMFLANAAPAQAADSCPDTLSYLDKIGKIQENSNGALKSIHDLVEQAGKDSSATKSIEWQTKYNMAIIGLQGAASDVRALKPQSDGVQELHRLYLVVADDWDALASVYSKMGDSMDAASLGKATDLLTAMTDHYSPILDELLKAGFSCI